MTPPRCSRRLNCAWTHKTVLAPPHPKAAQAFIDFLLSADAEKINAADGFRYPLRKDVDLPQAMPPLSQVKVAHWDFKQAAANVDAWKKQWSQITGQ